MICCGNLWNGAKSQTFQTETLRIAPFICETHGGAPRAVSPTTTITTMMMMSLSSSDRSS